MDLEMGSDGALYAAGSAPRPVLYVSRNKGLNWTELGQFTAPGASAAEAIATAFNNPQLIAVSTVSWSQVGSQKIFLSRDAGKTWTDISTDLPAGAGAAAMTFDRDGRFLYITRYAGSVYKYSL